MPYDETEMFLRVDAFREGKKIQDPVAMEREVRLMANDKLIARVKLSPGYEEEFALGYCFGEGLIKRLDQVKKINVMGNTIFVEAAAEFDLAYDNYLLSDCISGWRARVETEEVRVTSDYRVKAEEVLRNMRKLRRVSKVWRITGGVHSVALVSNDNFIVVEDISRHVALDKVVGLGIKSSVDFKKSYILTSGRLPGDMVLKVARLNIPIIASRTASLSSGIECALETNLTLIAFVRGKGMNIYTYPERIIHDRK
jgi:formate dehydrogenase accessory protein FdhD